MADDLSILPVNQAGWDRVLRVLLAAAMFSLGLSGVFPEAVGGGIRVASLLPLVTGALGWCPLYQLLGLSTRRAVPASTIETDHRDPGIP